MIASATLALLALAPQAVPDQDDSPDPATIHRVSLTPRVPGDGARMRWSPKGAKVPLRAGDAGTLHGSVQLGGPDAPARALRLERSADAAHHDTLRFDLDGDGDFDAAETLRCEPNERRGKWWSSFSCVVPLRVPPDDAADDAAEDDTAEDDTAEDDAAASTRPYALALWYVFDPREPEADAVLRFSRRGWHEGQVEIDGAPATVLLTDYRMDGVFTRADAWRIARDPADARAAPIRTLERHDWLDGAAWRVVAFDPHGRHLSIAPFDPGVTEEEELAAADRFAEDRAAPRAEDPLAFRHDVDDALAAAREAGSRVFLDFETTWCGPCKQMDRLVYTAQAVVDAAAGLVCIKADGDERRDLVERYNVTAYPTLLVLGADGAVLRRAVGYQSVADTAELLRGPADDGGD